MVKTRSKIAKYTYSNMNGTDRHSDDESECSVPEVLTREQMNEFDNENLLDYRVVDEYWSVVCEQLRSMDPDSPAARRSLTKPKRAALPGPRSQDDVIIESGPSAAPSSSRGSTGQIPEQKKKNYCQWLLLTQRTSQVTLNFRPGRSSETNCNFMFPTIVSIFSMLHYFIDNLPCILTIS